MADARIDNNRTKTLIGTSNADNQTPILLLVDPVTGRLLVQADIDMATEGIATEFTQNLIIDNQTNGTQETKITNGVDDVSVVNIDCCDVLNFGDIGLVTASALYGTNLLETGLKGVKVNDSNEMLTTASVSSSVMPNGGTPTHANGTVDDISPASLSPTGGGNTKAILVRNTHTTQNILVSLDDGTNWFTLPPYAVLSIDCSVSVVKVKGSAAGTTFQSILLS